MFNALVAMRFAGSIYPVSPKGGEIDGLKIYETVEEIPGEVDFAVISIAAHQIPAALEACRKKGAAGAEILSAGFSEMETAEGITLEEEIKRVARKGIRVIGPNCFGIYCSEGGEPCLGLLSKEARNSAEKGGIVVWKMKNGKLSMSHRG